MRGELWIVNWARATSSRQRGQACEFFRWILNFEFWIAHKLQACTSGGLWRCWENWQKNRWINSKTLHFIVNQNWFVKFVALHFGKVSDFGKVYESENQSLFHHQNYNYSLFISLKSSLISVYPFIRCPFSFTSIKAECVSSLGIAVSIG